MAMFDSGVLKYVTGVAEIKVYFPVDSHGNEHVNCFKCPYYSTNSHICQLNKKIPEFPDKCVGSECPLERIDD